jgi:UDP-N-acetylglucosamine 2-epimerase (non-hydrolysing)
LQINEIQYKRKIIIVAGARPNFIKIAPLIYCFGKQNLIKPILVHTGQHYDHEMSGQFFTDLNIPPPNINLEVGSGSHAVQTARIMERFEKVCINENPDFVFVVGDVNSTIACALVAVKLGIKLIHYEAGLRSNDRSMPEEINRLVTDSISDIYFTTCDDATKNLMSENVLKKRIFMFGNLMIDTLVSQMPKAITTELKFNLWDKTKTIILNTYFDKNNYGVVTLHRSENVDSKKKLTKLLLQLGQVSGKIPLIFPVHPRTFKNIQNFKLQYIIDNYPNLFIIEPLGYLNFLHLLTKSKFVITDSGGIQEETTYLNIPCLTVRPNTERPITLILGSSILIKVDDMISKVEFILAGKGKKGKIPKFWDGKTAERIVQQIQKIRNT